MEETETDQAVSSQSQAQLMNIEELPNEILLRIVNSLDYRTQLGVTLVSSRWHTIVDELIGRKLFVGRQCQYVPQDAERYSHKYVDVSAISKIGVSECYVGEVVDPGRTMTLFSYLVSKLKKAFYGKGVLEFKYPHLVKTLHFDGPVPPDYFDSMLKHVVNLTKLELHLTAFTTFEASNLQKLNWKRLQQLKIWGHRMSDGMFTTFYPSQKIIPNVLLLLSNHFPSLNFFSMEYPFDIREEKPLTQHILAFLRHHPNLVRFRICVNISITDDSQEFETGADREWIKESKTTSKQLKLKVIEIIVSSMRKIRLAKLWMAFLEQQKSLESVTILSFRVPPPMLALVCDNNWATLKRLFISRLLAQNNGRATQIDCNLLSRCVNLTSLTVEGMLSNFTEAGLIATRQLPKSLVHVELGGLPLHHQDAHDLFFELPELNNICLTDIGIREPFGITLDTIQQVISQRRIYIVTIYRSICGQFPVTGFPNGDPATDKLITKSIYDILEMKLNAAGFYENMQQFVGYVEDVD